MTEVLILTQIAGRACALRASDVETVIEIDAITPVPRAPKHIAGLTTLRSQALTVIDSRVVIGEMPSAYPTDNRAVVFRTDGHSYALRVDALHDVDEMLSQPEQITGGFGAVWSRLAEGMVETQAGPALLLKASELARTGEDARGIH
ncbi:MAG: chemotaxis protein CheW [Marinomonas sp.]